MDISDQNRIITKWLHPNSYRQYTNSMWFNPMS